ncbi:MAG: PIN domain-containing protein [Firmicutes bacterium]|nr:PIN domain-containing protein [Bacillota bacterium]
MIDTNVIIDVYQNRANFVAGSSKILKLSESKQIDGYITASTITDIYYILGRSLPSKTRVKTLVQSLLDVVILADVMASDVVSALNFSMDDFEDALLAQCAVRLGLDYIVTRNIKDFTNSPVAAIPPEEFLVKCGEID